MKNMSNIDSLVALDLNMDTSSNNNNKEMYLLKTIKNIYSKIYCVSNYNTC
jgi:hypothetical protein